MSNSNDLLLSLFDSILCDDNQTFTYSDIKITHSSENTEAKIKVLQSGGALRSIYDSEGGQFIAYDVDITTNTYPAEDKEYIIRSLYTPRYTLDFPADNDTIF